MRIIGPGVHHYAADPGNKSAANQSDSGTGARRRPSFLPQQRVNISPSACKMVPETLDPRQARVCLSPAGGHSGRRPGRGRAAKKSEHRPGQQSFVQTLGQETGARDDNSHTQYSGALNPDAPDIDSEAAIDSCKTFSLTQAKASEFWRNLLPALDQELLLTDCSLITPRQDNFFSELSLVLTARSLPHKLRRNQGVYQLMVPVLLEKLAVSELNEYLAELRQVPVSRQLPGRPNAQAPLMLLLCLVLLHGLRMGWWSEWLSGWAPDWLNPESPGTWLNAGLADSYLLLRQHEWYRGISSLGLHADSQHLFSNILFGGLFLIPLFRRVGSGPAFLLVTLGGFFGNLLNAWLQGPRHLSLGFSGAVFAAAGALAGLLAFENIRASHPERSLSLWRRKGLAKAFVCMGAALAFVAMLGTDGERTDVSGHMSGLFCGIGLGFAYSAIMKRVDSLRLWHIASFSLAAFLWLWAWANVIGS